jgi:squalene-hopene/tetraprenyl-beta-curcumene cyclase
VYGTGAVVPALIAAGVLPGKPAIRRAVRWLGEHQNRTAAGVRTCGPTTTRAWRAAASRRPRRRRGRCSRCSPPARPPGAGPPGAGDGAACVERGVRWLADHQRPDGTWDEPQYTGTGFPGDFYINYHLYRLVFPVSALGRYLAGDR